MITFPLWSSIPVIAMLLAIANFPLVPAIAHHWEKPRNQVLYALALGVSVAVTLLFVGHPELVTHAVIEYVQFIALLFALFTVSDGIFLREDIAATPHAPSPSEESATRA